WSCPRSYLPNGPANDHLFVGGAGGSSICARAGAESAGSNTARAVTARALAMAFPQTLTPLGGGAGAPRGVPSRNAHSQIEIGSGLVFSTFRSTGRITRKKAK